MLYHFIKKEFLLIFRDIHALLVLFIMPLIFITIMSFALKNNFSGTVDVKYKVAVVSGKLEKFKSAFFELDYLDKNYTKQELFFSKDYDFILNIPEDKKDIKIFTKSGISPQYVNILKSQITINLQGSILENILSQMGITDMEKFDLSNTYIGKNGSVSDVNSVNQSVPSWLIFSMFFVLIPISNAFINEKNFGTFQRIKSMNVSPWLILAGKFIPYLVVNQMQVLVMFLVGIFVMPLLGLDALHVRGCWGLIFIISLATSVGAIAFGLVIANIAKTSEEATTIGGISNIILAAIGGIMVPTFVMPKIMQTVSEFSPMSWSLNSFLDVIVRGEGFEEISSNVIKLIFLAIVCFFIAYQLLKRKEELR